MRILSIGNSFSQDAQRYLHRLAAAQGYPIETVNLYIGGCPLSHHAENLASGACAYDYEMNGECASRRVSLPEVLRGECFDVVTLQQASHESMEIASYIPHIDILAEAVRKYQPNARIYLHETWGYADGSERLRDVAQCATHREMYDRLHAAYCEAAAHIGAHGILPVGTAVMHATEDGIMHLHRDGFHLSLGAGRYLAALVWLGRLTDLSIVESTFSAFDEPIDGATRAALLRAAKRALEAPHTA